MISLFSFLHIGAAYGDCAVCVVVWYDNIGACVIDSLGLGITCVLYHCTICTRHPDLVSFAFCAIPIFHIII